MGTSEARTTRSRGCSASAPHAGSPRASRSGLVGGFMRRLNYGAWIGLVAAGTCLSSLALAQAPANAPPAVGVVKVTKHPVIETEQFIGRIQAAARVDVVARVTAYLDQVVFTEGAEVKKGDVLYRLERPPFEADVEAKQGVVGTIQAQLLNANLTLAARPNPSEHPGRPAIDRRCRQGQPGQSGGPASQRAGQPSDLADQPRLHGHHRTDRRQDRAHQRHGRQRGRPRKRGLGHRGAARIRCMWCSPSRCAARSSCGSATSTRAATAPFRSRSSCRTAAPTARPAS